jgi:hypothetical protein
MKPTSLKSTTRALAVGIFSLAAASSAHALVTIFNADFNSPTYSNGMLNSGTDTTTPGQDGWLGTNGTANLITVSNAATNGFVSLNNNGQDVRRIFDSGIAFTAGSSVWYDADINVSTALTGDYALHLGDGGTSLFYGRTYFKSSGTGFVLALATSSGTPTNYGTTVLNFGQIYHLLVRYDIVAGAANDTGALFINPTTQDGSGDTQYVAAQNIGTDATTIAAVAMRQGAAASAPTLTVDNLRVFSTAVPEPGTIAALVGGFAVLGLRRRSRRA